MWTTDAGVRFELSPWRARRVIAQAKEIARRRRDGQASLPGGVLHDLQRMARFARPVKNMVHQPTGNQMRVFEAQLPDGMFRMMTQSRPGLESVLGVAFRATEGELELEASYGGTFSIRWLAGEPRSLINVVQDTDTPLEPGIYLLFRRKQINGKTMAVPVYAGKATNLRQRLTEHNQYARQHGDNANLMVIYGRVLGSRGRTLLPKHVDEAISAAEHALIRTLNQNKGWLANISSTNEFRAKRNGLIVNSILPPYLRGMVDKKGIGHRLSSNRVVVEPNHTYEFSFK